MTSSVLGWLILTPIMIIGISCSYYKPKANMQRNIVTMKRSEKISSNSRPAVVIESIGIYAWWWSEQQIVAGFHEDIEVPKNTYIKLKQWQDIGDASVPHPDRVDIVCRVDNKGEQSADFIVSAIGDFKVESYGHIENSNETKDKNLDEVLETVPWTEENNLGQEIIDDLAPGESRKVKFKDFNLSAVLDKYSGDMNNDLWPWKFRVRINIVSSKGEHIAQGETILDIIPGD